ncbi:unnamed protein product [Ectocarpus sp. 6 AP-2014]
MVHTGKPVCRADQCFCIADYGVLGTSRQFCGAHSTAAMVNLSYRHCQKKGCTKRTAYGKPGDRATHCSAHKTDTMVKK